MSIADAFRIIPARIPDVRGEFYEALRTSLLHDASGYRFELRQANVSSSWRNTIRGIHGTSLPPGQAKIISCVQGAALDVAVDLRVGSPTFGRFELTHQDARSGVAVYLADGLGHAFLALTDDVRMLYLCSEPYVHGTMIELDALDPDLAIPWPLTGPPIRSAKDAAAPRLAAAAAAGRLPTLAQCQAAYAGARSRP